jgi:hypothetical protein
MRFSSASSGTYWRFSVDSWNTFYLQNHNGTGVYLVNGGTSWAGLSDERFKQNLQPIENSIDKICKLRAVTGQYKTDNEGVSRSFLIAQDVLNVFPEAVDQSNPEKLGIAYTDVIPLLVAAIKDLKSELDKMKAQNGN